MPARDPAASPQVLAPVPSSYTSHGLAQHQSQSNNGLLSPTSSNFSRTTSINYGSLSQSPTLATRFLRRVSGDRGRPSISGASGGAASGTGGSEPVVPQLGTSGAAGALGFASDSTGGGDLEAGGSGLNARRLSDVGYGRRPSGFANMALRKSSQDEQ